jgi:DNA mismatch repair ATPase MutS
MIPIFLLLSSTASLLLGLCGYAKMFPWLQIAPVLAPLLIAQAGIGLALMRRVRVHIKMLLSLVGDVAVLRQGIELVDRQEFHSAKLRDLVERLRQGGAAPTIRKLERRLIAIERREDVVLYGFSLWLSAGTQLVLSIERWRARHQSDFEDWLDAWAEFEALNALACYSSEHPDYVFPELLEDEATFEAKGLGHPLLPRDHCVGNDVVLNGSTAFYVVSGSNMAGKSTFLRAVGLNAVLASAGAPVRASSARVAVFRVCASIAINDSLQEGKSKFLAEVGRLRESIRATGEREPVLFLIDEILSGTNSRDRRIAAEALIGALVAGGAVGALSTHDLALTEIAENPELRGTNIHMQSDNPEQPLEFDYRVKPGISRQTNALAIVRMMGISV